ncbi:MAG: hypothetical protein EA362_14200 [Saprospirales bacterium]|nr:MAG: hypothetical protein EA362_14200 [Saprospirales bacterium]
MSPILNNNISEKKCNSRKNFDELNGADRFHKGVVLFCREIFILSSHKKRSRWFLGYRFFF